MTVVVVVLETTTAPGQPHLQVMIVSEGVCVINALPPWGHIMGPRAKANSGAELKR